MWPHCPHCLPRIVPVPQPDGQSSSCHLCGLPAHFLPSEPASETIPKCPLRFPKPFALGDVIRLCMLLSNITQMAGIELMMFVTDTCSLYPMFCVGMCTRCSQHSCSVTCILCVYSCALSVSVLSVQVCSRVCTLQPLMSVSVCI